MNKNITTKEDYNNNDLKQVTQKTINTGITRIRRLFYYVLMRMNDFHLYQSWYWMSCFVFQSLLLRLLLVFLLLLELFLHSNLVFCCVSFAIQFLFITTVCQYSISLFSFTPLPMFPVVWFSFRLCAQCSHVQLFLFYFDSLLRIVFSSTSSSDPLCDCLHLCQLSCL